MALNKRKVLDSARKFAQKGAKAKALKEYNLLLQADPRDAKLLLEVGDAYRRWGQTEDAIAQYAKVAQQYRQDGFDARAVAVYKQILNLDPKHYAAYVSLSELYQRMGLDAEAIGALQTAADGYHREGRKADALELLRQMAALDPTNTTSRLKVAELLRQEKMTAEALAEYEAAARELENQQDRDQLVAVRERILELKPDHLGALTGMVRTLMVAGKLDRAEPFALRALQVSAEPAQYDLVIELFAQMGNDAKLAEATRGLAKLYRDRGEEDKARELMQRLPADEVGARSRLAVDVSEIGEPQIGDEELLEDDPFVTLSGTRASEANDLGEDELELGADDEIQLEEPRHERRAASQPLEGDPDQLFAEASVYLRYGKRAQAIQSLRTVLEQDPNHRAALEKLGEAYVDEGRVADAVASWMRAAELIRASGDAKALSVLRDRIATLDPAAAARIADPKPAAPTGPPVADLDLDLEVELELGDAVSDGTAAADDSAQAAQAGVDVGDETDLGFEIELDDSEDGLALGADVTEEAVADEAMPPVSLSGDDGFEFEIDPGEITGDGPEEAEGFTADDLGTDAALSPDLGASAAGTSMAPGSTTTTARIQEELEEAEFYIAQEMYDEAESILSRILETAPNHPSALLRLGEVQVARGAAPDAAPAASDARTRAGRRVAGTSERDLGSTSRFEDGLDLESPDVSFSAESASDGDESDTLESEGTSGHSLEIDLDLDDESGSGLVLDSASASGLTLEPDLHEEEEALGDDTIEDETDPVAISVPRAAVTEPPRSSAAPAAPTPAAMQPPALAAEPPAAMGGDVFDLREALADVFDDAGDSARGISSGAVLSTVEDGFESIFSDFKKGVSATLDQGDYDTRYDLGIAYREMGLYADAIGEFQICLESPARRFDSLYLMGLCARDLERPGDAVHHLEQALALPDLPEDRLAGVFFDLALAQELAGDRHRACASMRRVIELDPRFPNAKQRLAELEGPARATPTAAPSAGAGQGFESFDDLFSEESGDEAGEEAAPVESFESFDDVVNDVEAASVDPEPEPPPAPPMQSGPEATSDPNAQSGRKSGRKKISFV
ncbi:MAG: tetratricopeptide repeat protein [Myxococcota bacterium]